MKLILNRCLFVATVIGTTGLLSGLLGCGNGSPRTVTSAAPAVEKLPAYADAEVASAEFENSYRLKTSSGNFIEVESPGYACPTMADVDDDGDEDLIVGQFSGGNMQLYRNESGSAGTPKFGCPEWISSNGERAEVPGIS